MSEEHKIIKEPSATTQMDIATPPEQLNGTAAPEFVLVDVNRARTNFPHFWEHGFGSCHAPITLCEDWRNDLRTVKKIVDIKTVRFHGIFDRETGLYAGEDEHGHPILNFTRVDLIYDGLLKNGVRPFIELSFMPDALADDVAGSIHPFAYHQNVAPPKSYLKWYELVHRFTAHLVERYGIEEVSQWLFEVWNEPNIDFLAGEGSQKQERYFLMYDLAAQAVKDVSERIQVGGPATAQAAWVSDFINHCVRHNVAVDFVSTHIYPNDDAMTVLRTNVGVTQENLVALAVRKVHDEVQASARPDLPIIWSEFNAGFDGGQTDEPYVGPWLANTIRLCDGYATEMMYWTFTDAFFEEGGVFPSPFNRGFGLIATGSIPKAPFNVFKTLHFLGTERISDIGSESALATIRKDGRVVVALWNYVLPRQHGGKKSFSVELAGRHCRYALVHLVDEDHGNAMKAWKTMGEPAFPTPAQQQQLRSAGELPAPHMVRLTEGKRLTITLEPNALAVVEFMD